MLNFEVVGRLILNAIIFTYKLRTCIQAAVTPSGTVRVVSLWVQSH